MIKKLLFSALVFGCATFSQSAPEELATQKDDSYFDVTVIQSKMELDVTDEGEYDFGDLKIDFQNLV
jgi:hypothetical protein